MICTFGRAKTRHYLTRIYISCGLKLKACEFLPPANKVWGKVMFFTCVCHSVHRSGDQHPGGGVCVQRGLLQEGACLQGGLHPGGFAYRGIGQTPSRNWNSYRNAVLLKDFLLFFFVQVSIGKTQEQRSDKKILNNPIN